jgi:hypothetical protein
MMVSPPLRGKTARTYHSVFENPVRADIRWDDIVTLLRALGADVSEGRGSRVRVSLFGADAVFHRPHPAKETDKNAVRSVRRFLVEAGIE